MLGAAECWDCSLSETVEVGAAAVTAERAAAGRAAQQGLEWAEEQVEYCDARHHKNLAERSVSLRSATAWIDYSLCICPCADMIDSPRRRLYTEDTQCLRTGSHCTGSGA